MEQGKKPKVLIGPVDKSHSSWRLKRVPILDEIFVKTNKREGQQDFYCLLDKSVLNESEKSMK